MLKPIRKHRFHVSTRTPKSLQNDLQKSDYSRRLFLLSAALFIAGCGTKKVTSTLPSPIWDYKPAIESAPVVVPAPVKQLNVSAIARSSWAKGNPIPRNMNKMLPVRYITVHHDGMTAFKSTSRGAASAGAICARGGKRSALAPWKRSAACRRPSMRRAPPAPRDINIKSSGSFK